MKVRLGRRTPWSAPSPQTLLPPGGYLLSADGDDWQRTAEFEIAAEEDSAIVVSYNANLAAEQLWNSIGRQHRMRGSLDKAGTCFARAGTSDETILNIARLKALRGDLDGSRDMVTPILNRQLGQFEALALIRIAADFYRRALQIRKSPEVENALTAVTQ